MEGFDHKVADITLADWGRKEILQAELEMPGLMSCRSEFGPQQPLAGAHISGSLHMTVETAVLIETLKHLGAEVRWCSCNIYSTQDHAAAAIVAKKSANVFAVKGETLDEYWLYTLKALTWPGRDGPDMIVDDGADATLMIHEGVKWEDKYAKDKILPDLSVKVDEDYYALLKLLAKIIPEDPTRFHRMAKGLIGSSEETTTGVHRLKQMAERKELLFPVINVNDSVTKSKFDNIYGCRHSLLDGVKRATDRIISGRKVLVCGFGDVGKGCAQALHAECAIVYVTECDPICALQACMSGYTVVKAESIIDQVDLVVTATGCCKIITIEHMKKMKDNTIVCNIGHFDNEIAVSDLVNYPGIKEINIKTGVDKFVFPDGHSIILLARGRLINLGCATGHPAFVMSNSFTNQTLAQMELWQKRDTEEYKEGVHVLPKHLDEKVAMLHLGHFKAELTALTPEQAKYIGVPLHGPFKDPDYRY
eukprot:TRINITY_DN8874_c0_g1_i1.p1 TRINITY_DN8874_c0_g1~~TRINITY_DN8874_c0_g1_i1.p1  ORF type:complete len:478 (+),score=172.98 TRINITY_DN8874_c0_g1_i1:251-1684(+)